MQIKYDGYIKIQLEQVEAMRKLEKKALPADIDYNDIKSLRLEAIEKLNKIKPVSSWSGKPNQRSKPCGRGCAFGMALIKE